MNIKSLLSNKFALLRMSGVRIALLFGALFIMPFVAYTGSASANYGCGSAQLCVWHEKFGGGGGTQWGGTWRNTCWNMVPSWDNVISSVQNNMSVKVTFYDSKDCAYSAPAWQFGVNPGQSLSAGESPYTFAWYMDNKISSVYFH